MTNRATFSDRERELRSRLHALINRAEDFVHGSAIESSRRCGNPDCSCQSDDRCKHRSVYLGQTRNRKTSSLFIPRHLEARVREGIANFAKAQELLEELNLEARKRLEEAKAAAKASAPKRKAAKHKPATRKKPHLKKPS